MRNRKTYNNRILGTSWPETSVPALHAYTTASNAGFKELNQMNPTNSKIRWPILTVLLGLLLFAMLSYNKSGEIIRSIAGQVQRCEVLGGGKEDSLFHATIKTQNGSYIIASMMSCSPSAKVTVLIKRGALYFNTLYAVEEA